MLQAAYGESPPFNMHYLLKNKMVNIYMQFEEEDLVHDTSSLYFEIMKRGHAPNEQEIYDDLEHFRDLLM